MIHVRFDQEIQETQTDDKNMYLNGLVFKANEGFESYVGQRVRVFLDRNPDAMDLEAKTAEISFVPQDYIVVKTPQGDEIKSWNITDVEAEKVYSTEEAKGVKALIAQASTANLVERGTRTVEAKGTRPRRPGLKAAVANAQPEGKSADAKVPAEQSF